MSTYRIKKRRRSHIGPILLIAAGLLLILLMIWQLSIKAAAMPSAFAPAVSTEITRVELEEARATVERGEAVFIDVRDAELFANEHITGALNIPLDTLPTKLSALDPDLWYIPYCT
jgi:hypothetical protein